MFKTDIDDTRSANVTFDTIYMLLTINSTPNDCTHIQSRSVVGPRCMAVDAIVGTPPTDGQHAITLTDAHIDVIHYNVS